MTPQQIKAHSGLSETEKEAYSSVAAARLNKELINTLGVTDPNVGEFIDQRGDYVLGLSSEDSFRNWLQNELKLKPVHIDLVVTETKKHLDGKLLEPDQVLVDERTAAKPLRTMATDIEKIHGYGAGTSSASEATTSQKAPQQDEEPVHTSSQESVLTQSTNTSPHGPAAPQPTQHVQPSTSNAAPVAEPAQPTPRPTAAAPSFTPTPPTTPTAPVPPAAPTSVAGTPPAPASPPTDLPTSGGNDMPSFTPTHTAPPAPQPRTDETGPAAPDTTPPDTRWG